MNPALFDAANPVALETRHMNAPLPARAPSHVHAVPHAMPLGHGMPATGLHEALADALAALDRAEERQRPVDMVQAFALVGRSYRSLGEHAAAEWYLQRGLCWARTLGGVDASVELLCELSDVAASLSAQRADEPRRAHASREQARDHGFEAARLARQCADPQWEVTVLLRISDVLDRCGDHDDAIALQFRALQLISGDAPSATATPQAAAPAHAM
jgi:hypothetical protein